VVRGLAYGMDEWMDGFDGYWRHLFVFSFLGGRNDGRFKPRAIYICFDDETTCKKFEIDSFVMMN